MTKAPDNPPDAVPARTVKTPPKPKSNPVPPATKAQIAAQKRADKMVIKRMRKR